MTSAIPPTTQNTTTTQSASSAPTIASSSNLPQSGAVPAPLPGRSYASATKTASTSSFTPAGASAPSQNAKPTTESPVNGATPMAQGGPQAASAVPNGTPATEHGRKPSVIISASGASGSTPNGGPVGQNGRPPISFGSMNSQGSPLPPASVPYQSQTSSLPTPRTDPRVISPAHSPSPIPQPPASGGRPPSSFPNQSNGMTFGSMGGESDPMRQNQMQAGMGPGIPMHERRQSSQSMQGDPNMNRNFGPPNGRGRGFPPAAYGMPSPGPNYRLPPGAQPRPGPNMGPQFQQQMPPGSPYSRGRNSPALPHGQPSMPPQHMAPNPQMAYGGYPQMGGQGHPQNMYPYYDPNSGYYQPYWNAQPSQSPRPPSYPSPFNTPQGSMAPPFHPPAMSRNSSQASERPASSMGQPSTPSVQNAPPSTQPQANQASQPPNAFQRPKKGNSAIKIMNPLGGEVNVAKSSSPSAAAAPPQTPVIVSTPSAPTPPPRVPSSQHDRTESKSTLTAEERKRAFQEEVKRRQMEEKPKSEASESVQPQAETEDPPAQKEREATEGPANDVVKEATAEAEKAAAVDAGDKESEQAAETAEAAEAAVAHAGKEASDVAEKEETEEERMDRMIAEMEAKEKEDEEREQVYEEKRKKEKEEKAKLEAEKAAKEDEELKRQEREAEEREEQREREREAAREADKGEDTDDQAKDMFAALKKSNLGPGASTPGSGTETPASEEAEPSSMPPPAQPASQTRPAGAGAQKPKPAHLKLETSKRVEPAEPTPGMQALKSARFLEVKEEAFYPAGVSSPNPALNTTGLRQGRAYDKSFLLQFKDVFREKPSIDWDQKVKDTLGSSEDSARPQSARTPSTNVGRSASGRPGPQGPMASFGGPMGAFGTPGNRTIPPGTTSQERFQASQQGMRPGMGNMQMGRVPSQFGGMPPGVGMSRTNSLQTMSNMVPGSPRQGSTRGGKGGSRRGDRTLSKREEADMAAKMPLTAHLDVKGLEKSTTGWKASSLGQGVQAQHDPSGHLAPDMVQRKVKAALNKMTPSTFDRISDQILEIAAQSKTESDGRTLRQVIQLTFEKACDEAHWAGMYAQFCQKMLTTMSTEIRDETINDKNGNPVVGGALFRKYLLNRCQEEFERGWQVNLPDKPEGESQEAVLLSDEYYVAAAAKRRGLGLIQFIGQLYKLRMLTLRIMHECVMKLLNFEGDPDESAVENLTTLLKSVGATMEEDEQGTKLLDTYFERIEGNLLKSEALPSRPKFMLLDLVDLRRARWKGKDDSKGPKTINQIHAEAEAQHRAADLERQRTAARGPPGGRPPAGRGDARNFSGGMPPPQPNLVGSDDLRRLQNRQNRPTGGGLGPGGSLGPGSSLGARTGSRRGNLGPPSSGNTTRTNTPPVEKEKKEEPSAQNAFSALASLDSGEAPEDAASQSEAASPPAARNRSKSPLAAENAEDNSTA